MTHAYDLPGVALPCSVRSSCFLEDLPGYTVSLRRLLNTIHTAIGRAEILPSASERFTTQLCTHLTPLGRFVATCRCFDSLCSLTSRDSFLIVIRRFVVACRQAQPYPSTCSHVSSPTICNTSLTMVPLGATRSLPRRPCLPFA